MRSFLLSFSFVLLAGCSAEPVAAESAASAVETGPAFSWPIPDGWRAETIPFPLGFAPSIPYRGVEELRFAPRFFDPSSPTYFTYSFAFVLEGTPAIGPEVFASDLHTYFTGLASAVTGAPSDPSLHVATIAEGADGRLRGTVRTIDAFGDRRTLDLHLEAETFTCGERRVVIASLSPHAPASPIWSALATVRGSFRCTSTP
ncbi:MAG: hypothetical protein KIT84_02905 [Labilithrix sp.]|nr:hypothetical protein [Labilithrix sp.]MCW5809931.1 hypothetical protein [Labilithrix sp.]